MDDDHIHQLPEFPPEPGWVGFCEVPDCTYAAVTTEYGWRNPTPQEQTAITLRQWEDLIYLEAFTIIHGKTVALRKIREMRGYDHG